MQLPSSHTGVEKTTSILSLPSDVLIIIMDALVLRDLAALSETCKNLHTLVSELGVQILPAST
jgi:hypothetical protein